jgi:hypothetical protein
MSRRVRRVKLMAQPRRRMTLPLQPPGGVTLPLTLQLPLLGRVDLALE